MKILLRKTTDPDREPRVYALDPETGQALTRIENPSVWCVCDNGLSTAHEHPEGIYWLTMSAAIAALKGPHKIVFDDGNEPAQVFTIRLPAGLHERLKNAALDASRGGPRVSMAELAREAIEKYLK